MIRIGLLVYFISISGCSVFQNNRNEPVLISTFEHSEGKRIWPYGNWTQEYKKGFSIAATTAQRRLALVNLEKGKVCLEPPPEAANTISEALSAILSAHMEWGLVLQYNTDSYN